LPRRIARSSGGHIVDQTADARRGTADWNSRLNYRRLLCVTAVALIAGACVLYATRDAVTTGPDSAVYAGTAHSVETGHWLDVPIHYYPLGKVDIGTPPAGRFTPALTPLVIYAPLEPVLLAAAGDPVGTARVEDALFFALAVLVIGLFVLLATDQPWLAAAAQVVVGGSLLGLVTDVGTSAPSLFFVLVALSAVIAFRRQPSRRWLILAALAIGLATLERFANGALIVWAVLALWDRRRAAIALLVMGSIPLVAWFVYEDVSGRSSGHMLGLHVVGGSFRGGARSIADWVLPSSAPTALALLAALAVVVAVFVIVRHRPTTPALLLVLYAVVQIVMLEVAITFFDALVNLDSRELIPCFAAVVMAVACSIERTPALKLVVGLAVIGALARGGVEIASDIPGGYAEPRWVHSPIMAALRALPPRTVVYTNAPDAGYLLADRVTSSVPEEVDFSTLERNPRLDAQLAEIRRTLSARGGVLVYVRGLGRDYLPSEASLVRRLPLRLVRQTSDGAVYALARPGA
jgi:hypothetical protein